MLKEIVSLNNDEDTPASISLSRSEARERLKNILCSITDINYLEYYLQAGCIYEYYNNPNIYTLIVKPCNNKPGFVIKISDEEELFDTYNANEIFKRLHLGSENIEYFRSNKDYLIMSYITGSRLLDIYHKKEDLYYYLGYYLREFHKIESNKLWFNSEERLLLKNNRQNLAYPDCDNKFLIHGNFTPENIYIRDGALVSLTHNENVHLGDIHYDVLISLTSLDNLFPDLADRKKNHNLFYRGYGYEFLDFERLEEFKESMTLKITLL